MTTQIPTSVLHTEDQYVAECVQVGTVSQGKSVEESAANLKEATELYLEVFSLTELTRFFYAQFGIRPGHLNSFEYSNKKVDFNR